MSIRNPEEFMEELKENILRNVEEIERLDQTLDECAKSLKILTKSRLKVLSMEQSLVKSLKDITDKQYKTHAVNVNLMKSIKTESRLSTDLLY